MLSFNYTDTFERIYGENSQIEYCYIHGRVDERHTVETSDIVLGIDEYLPDERKNSDLEFIAFKKYYQRILKGTGAEYLRWIEQIKTEEDRFNTLKNNDNQLYKTPLSHMDKEQYVSDVYIFGHSLDVTDGDVLREFICRNNVITHIYYHVTKDDKTSARATIIQNLIKVIGQDELIRRTGGSSKTIELIEQTIE